MCDSDIINTVTENPQATYRQRDRTKGIKKYNRLARRSTKRNQAQAAGPDSRLPAFEVVGV